MFRAVVLTLVITLAILPEGKSPRRPDTPKSLRIYVFDSGSIKGIDPAVFRFKREELAEIDLAVVSYLIVHPKGTLMWETGVIPDSRLPTDGTPRIEGEFTVTKALLPQLAAVGYTPADITYLAMSHYHWDHTANANEFAGCTWIVQQAEYDAMLAAQIQSNVKPAYFSKLKDSKTIILRNMPDYDVFGDGTVVLKSTPGHTPGHQVLFVKLPKTGPIVLSGDLYHYPEERTLYRVPTREFNAEQTVASRAAVEAFLKKTGAQLWIEHDIATYKRLKKAPDYIE